MSSAAIPRVGGLDIAKFNRRDLLEVTVGHTLILLTLRTSGTTQRVLLLTSAT
jgi:hypothetical protein